tara:strand:+ start:104 stop:799 length:696 start_codon:yes stop_codon:yes gene_type:complete
MRKFIKSTLSVALAALMSVSMFAHAGEAVAEEGGMSVSYNIGYMSEYWYRGAYQAESSMSFGADVEMGSMYVGMWGADVSDAAAAGSGTEIDLYAGYNFELMSIPMYLGVTGYYYTDNFDRDYEEVNFGGDFGMFSFDAAVLGSYKSDADNASSDYGHFTLTVPLGMLDYSYQTFTGGSLHYATHELNYSTSVSGIDLGATLGRNNDGGAGASPNSNQETTYANFTIGYSF